MKKVISVLLAVMLALTATACGIKNELEKEPEAAQEVVETTPTETLSSLESEDDYRLTSYAVVLGTYRQALKEEWDYEKLMEYELSELLIPAYDGDAMANVGYTFLDFNLDGVDELIIGTVNQDGYAHDVIYDMYALVDGIETHVFSSHERDRYYLSALTDAGNDYTLNRLGSSGATSTEYTAMNWSGTDLKLYQAVRYDANDANAWMQGSEADSNYEPIYSSVIDEQLGQDIINNARNNFITPDYTPFTTLQ